jgi:prepilin-type N-terminal cleavage/methylation domain-containing protein
MQGFTLIELIMVMLIAAVAFSLVVVVTRYGGGVVELNTFVKETAATLRYARNYAVAHKKVYSFILSEDKKSYSLYADLPDIETDENPPPVLSKEVPESLDVVFKDKTEVYRIDFYPQGNSRGGVLQISNQKGKILFIIINRVTGKIEVKNTL